MLLLVRYCCYRLLVVEFSLDFVKTKRAATRSCRGPRNAQFISIRQVASDAATPRRCTCGPPLSASAAAAAAAIKKFTD